MSPQPPSSPARLELRLASDPSLIAAARHAVETFSAAAGLLPHAVADIGLCLNEALANVIRHAYSGTENQPITLTAERLDGTADDRPYAAAAVRITIRDWGSGFNPATVPPKPHNPLQPGGLGLICLQSLMDQVVFTPQPDGMLLSMTRGNRPQDELPDRSETVERPPASQEPTCPS